MVAGGSQRRTTYTWRDDSGREGAALDLQHSAFRRLRDRRRQWLLGVGL